MVLCKLLLFMFIFERETERERDRERDRERECAGEEQREKGTENPSRLGADSSELDPGLKFRNPKIMTRVKARRSTH